MPARNSRKQYLENGYYHLYNRGVEKRKIFEGKQDYSVFLSYLKEYLLPKNEKDLLDVLTSLGSTPSQKQKAQSLLRMNNFSQEISLLAYSLMPNHFHFFVKQKNAGSIDSFMNSLGTRYTMYFNKRYDRVGSLYQSVYKAVSVTKELQFIYLSKYIHKQALIYKGEAFQRWDERQPCSYFDYLGLRKTDWVHPGEILSFFSENNPGLSYKSFVEQDDDVGDISDVIIEED
jgi:putative transposase